MDLSIRVTVPILLFMVQRKTGTPALSIHYRSNNMSKLQLQGKIAVVTGGSSGIGLATAQRFVAEGAYVFITGRRQSELDKAVELIGANVTAVQGDVSNLADLDRLYATVKASKGRLDVLVANSGIVDPTGIADVTV